MTNSVVRYSDDELAEFKDLIEKRLSKANEQLESLQEQILEITENSSDEHGGDWVDDSSINNDVEMLNNMAIRQRMYIQDLENALIRIRNKTYGICSVTGELIDKKRLMAVPTTTKSLAAKTGTSPEVEKEKRKEERRPKSPSPIPSQPKVITKIIRKPTTNPPKPSIVDDEDEDDLFGNDLFFNDDDTLEKAVGDLKNIVEETDDVVDEIDEDIDPLKDEDEGEDFDEDDEDDEDR